MDEQGLALVDSAVGCREAAVLPGPGVEALEEDFVNLAEIRVGDLGQRGEVVHDLREVGPEEFVFGRLDDVKVLLGGEVAQVARGVEVLKRIEHAAVPGDG